MMDRGSKQSSDHGRVSRRDVLRSVGAAAVLGSVGARPAGAQDAAKAKAGVKGITRLDAGATKISLTLNGKATKVALEPRTTLLDALRDRVGLTGAKRICDRGACGGCTVWVDGKPVNSCMMLAVDAVGAKVTTVEGLAKGETLHPVQQAFVECDAMQCGFCTPGMVMSCAALLESNPRPKLDEIQHALSGNLCRCGTYPHIFDACQKVAAGGGK